MHDSRLYVVTLFTISVIISLKIYKGIFTSDFRFNTVVLKVFFMN